MLLLRAGALCVVLVTPGPLFNVAMTFEGCSVHLPSSHLLCLYSLSHFFFFYFFFYFYSLSLTHTLSSAVSWIAFMLVGTGFVLSRSKSFYSSLFPLCFVKDTVKHEKCRSYPVWNSHWERERGRGRGEHEEEKRVLSKGLWQLRKDSLGVLTML